jgi:hypothetical protein
MSPIASSMTVDLVVRQRGARPSRTRQQLHDAVQLGCGMRNSLSAVDPHQRTRFVLAVAVPDELNDLSNLLGSADRIELGCSLTHSHVPTAHELPRCTTFSISGLRMQGAPSTQCHCRMRLRTYSRVKLRRLTELTARFCAPLGNDDAHVGNRQPTRGCSQFSRVPVFRCGHNDRRRTPQTPRQIERRGDTCGRCSSRISWRVMRAAVRRARASPVRSGCGRR